LLAVGELSISQETSVNHVTKDFSRVNKDKHAYSMD